MKKDILTVLSTSDNADGSCNIEFDMSDEVRTVLVQSALRDGIIEYAKKSLLKEKYDKELIKKLVDAIYPILIPVEVQCMEIQAKNYELIESLATLVYTEFISECLK